MITSIVDQITEGRRKFLNALLAFFSMISFIGIVYPVGIFLWPRAGSKSAARGRFMRIASADAPIGEVKFIRFLNKPAMLIRPNEQEIIALSAICTHLGCVVKWNESKGELFCPCHGGRFDLRGKVLGGPPPAPLASYKVRIENEYIVIEEV